MKTYILGTVFGRQEVYMKQDDVYYIIEFKKKGIEYTRTVLCPERVNNNFKEVTEEEALNALRNQ